MTQHGLPAGDVACSALLALRAYADAVDTAPPTATDRPDGSRLQFSAESIGHDRVATIVQRFALSSFERDLLLLCLAAEVDPGVDVLCARAQQHARRIFPTFSLAMSILEKPHWDAIAPTSPLRKWRLVDVVMGDTLSTSPLRIDERILHFLLGTDCVDKRICDLVLRAEAAPAATASVVELSGRVAGILASSLSEAPAVQLQGVDPERMHAVAATAAAVLGIPLYLLPSLNIPSGTDELVGLAMLWERETILGSGLLAIDCSDDSEAGRSAAQSLLERMRSPVLTIGREQLHLRRRAGITIDVPRPSAEEQTGIWNASLGGLTQQTASAVAAIVRQFDLTSEQIRSACEEVTAHDGSAAAGPASDDEIAAQLWSACRRQSRVHLEELAHRIEPNATWGDLVLPGPQKEMLKQIVAHVRRRSKVHEEWGFAAKSSRGLGTAVLFSGTSGTGKTLSAEVIANELKLDLYHIDLSSIVSKYIGETEKNLRRIFDAADESGAVLLFDEADALFGKRSEVKDSHDRYANLEVSYLLQRIESYRGLAILTTNMKQALDSAFLRRIRFIVNFEYPDAIQRAEIWWRVIPPSTPTDGLNFTKLATLNIAGGSIWNIALQAAYLAADADEPVRMHHMLQAAKIEYAKLEKPLSDTDVHGWI